MPFPPRLRACLAAAALLLAPPLAAHEGHDHDAPAAAVPAKPRVAVHSDLYELVAVREAPDRLRIWLDLFEGNEPVTAARIEVTVGDAAAAAEPDPDGTFRLVSPALARPGAPLDLIFSVTEGPAGDDLLTGILPALPATEAPSPSPTTPGMRRWTGPRRGRSRWQAAAPPRASSSASHSRAPGAAAGAAWPSPPGWR
jgi:hypothetical protein